MLTSLGIFPYSIFSVLQEGCTCKDTEFGCCPDRKTPADGVNGLGCGCAASKYGCCPDGETDAEGKKRILITTHLNCHWGF